MQIRPTTATIDLNALRHNIAVIRGYAPDSALCAVIKANGYGHGLAPIGKAAADAGAEWLGVALVEEGVALREAGVETPILVLSSAFEGGYDAFFRYRLTPAIGREDQLRAYAAAAPAGARAPFHLKIDTGMARLGFIPAEITKVIGFLSELPGLELEGVLSHFANADLGDMEFNRAQLETFRGCEALLREAGYTPRWVHLANSAAVISLPEAHGNMVRPGLMLYGLDPFSPARCHDVKPVMRWHTRAVHLKDIPAGTRVSYGGRWTAPRPSRIITLPVGYADGYPRRMSGKAEVLVRGKRAPIVGTICMDLCVADVTDIPDYELSDEVVLMGAQGDARVTAEELAEWAETISYEIICGITKRVPRVYVG